MSRERIFALTRHVLTFVGGLFVVKGVIDESLLNELIGGSLALAGTIWSILDKK